MSILPDFIVKKYLENGRIKIENFVKEHLGPVSYDLTINDNVRLVERTNGYSIDCTQQTCIGAIVKLPIDLKYGESIVFTTDEIIYVDQGITGIVYPRSSLTKIPLLFNIAGLVDPGFNGSITGTIYNFSASKIEIKKMRICQIVFHEHEKVEVSYEKRKTSKNQNQSGILSLYPKKDSEFKIKNSL